MMGRKTKRVYYLGIVFIILLTGYKPFLLSSFGKVTEGKVIGIAKIPISTSGGLALEYPVVEYPDNNQWITFHGGVDLDEQARIGQTVKVIYFPEIPKLAEVKKFNNLYGEFIIIGALCLILWFALMTSFNDIFDRKFTLFFNSSY
jgi:hypothetical protein